MSSSDDEAHSPDLGACSSKDPPPPLESESSDIEDQLPKKKGNKSYARPRIEWREVIRFSKGDDAMIGEDEMKLQITQAYNKIMEDARMVRLPGHVPGPTDVGLWKLKTEYTVDHGRTSVKWMRCPMSYRFNCQCQIKLYDGPAYTLLEVRGVHDADSHAPEKEKSKHLTVKQIEAIQTGVRMAPSQSARTLRRNLTNFSAEQQIDPLKLRHMRRKVAKFRADLTIEQLSNYKIDDSFGSLVRYSEAKWFQRLIDMHNDEGSPFHFNLFEPFVIGRDLKAKDDIVYLNFSSIWHLCNFLRNLAAGWLLQINGDGTYKVCRRGVAIYCIGVNSIPHINNPVCWAVIPESESKAVIQGTFRAVQTAVFMLMKQIKRCSDPACQACVCISDLMDMQFVQDFMKKPAFEAEKLEVHTALSDCSLGWTSFTLEEFDFEANMCTNHTTGIPAAKYSQQKYYKSREIYDAIYNDFMVRIAKLGVETIVNKAHKAVVRWLIESGDKDGAAYWEKTWSMESGHGRWSIVHAQYAGCNSNASMECMWKFKSGICPPTATLGTMLGGLFHTIEELG